MPDNNKTEDNQGFIERLIESLPKPFDILEFIRQEYGVFPLSQGAMMRKIQKQLSDQGIENLDYVFGGLGEKITPDNKNLTHAEAAVILSEIGRFLLMKFPNDFESVLTDQCSHEREIARHIAQKYHFENPEVAMNLEEGVIGLAVIQLLAEEQGCLSSKPDYKTIFKKIAAGEYDFCSPQSIESAPSSPQPAENQPSKPPLPPGLKHQNGP